MTVIIFPKSAHAQERAIEAVTPLPPAGASCDKCSAQDALFWELGAICVRCAAPLSTKRFDFPSGGVTHLQRVRFPRQANRDAFSEDIEHAQIQLLTGKAQPLSLPTAQN